MEKPLYVDFDREKVKLLQGDLIKCENNDDLFKKIWDKCPPDFIHETEYFAITTQSCDLEHLKAKFISLSPVTPFKILLEEYLKTVCVKKIDRVLYLNKKKYSEDFVSKLLTFAVPDYFPYAFEGEEDDEYIQQTQIYIAWLRFSITIELTKDNIKLFKKWKEKELNSVFRDKLGANISYMYSRIAVPECNEIAVKKMLFDLIDSPYIWLENERIAALQKDNSIIDGLNNSKTIEDKLKIIDKQAPLGHIEYLCELFKKSMRGARIEKGKINEIINSITEKGDLKSYLDRIIKHEYEEVEEIDHTISEKSTITFKEQTDK